MIVAAAGMYRRLVKSAADLLWQWVLRLERLPRAVIFASGLALMLVIALGAGVASADAGYDELLLLPIVSVAWLTSSSMSGVTMVALAAVLRMGDSVFFESDRITLVLSDTVVHTLLYLAVVLLLGLVRRDRDRQEALAVTDSLTEVANNRFLRAAALTELERSRRYSHAMSLLYIDIDEFK
ncbi:MAG: GGDEF domain-containing protein, partial [Thermoleophilia bacterium]